MKCLNTCRLEHQATKQTTTILIMYLFQGHVNETERMQNEISYYTEESGQIIKDGDILLEEALENTRVILSTLL